MFRKLRVVIVLMAASAVAARAATLTVGPGQPYTTIQSAIVAASAGDTVLVLPGTYYENIDFKGKAIRVQSVVGPSATLLDGGGNGPAVSFKTGESSAAVLSGLTIRHGGSYTNGTYPGGIGSVYVNGSSPTISNNLITLSYCYGVETSAAAPLVQGNDITQTLDPNGQCSAAGGSAVYLNGNLGGGLPTPTSSVIPLIVGNMIENNVESGNEQQTGSGGAGIAVWTSSPLIENNTIRNNASPGGTGAAINIVGGADFVSRATDVVIVQNLIYGNSAGCGGGAIATQVSADSDGFALIVANNTIVDNTGSATSSQTVCEAISQIYPAPFEYTTAGPTQIFVNNIISGSSAAPTVNCANPGGNTEATQPLFDHNILYNGGGPFFGGYCVDVTGKYGNVTSAPQFVDAANHNYQLKSGSPGIDAGTTGVLQSIGAINGTTLATDFAGNNRVVDATGKGYPIIDFGAYEFTGVNDGSATSMVLVSSAYTGDSSDQFTLTATLVSALGNPPGTVAFYEDGQPVAGAQAIAIINGIAELKNVLIVPGIHSFDVVYGGSGSFTPAVAVNIIVNIYRYSTGITISSIPNPSYFKQPVTFTVTVSSSDPGFVPSPVYIFEGNRSNLLATLDQSQINSFGVGMYTTSTLSVGTHNIIDSYDGDLNHSPAYPTYSVYQTVLDSYGTTLYLTTSQSPSYLGQSVTFTASIVDPASQYVGIPTGAVEFSYNGTIVDAPLNSAGNASVSTALLPVGTYKVVATYKPTGSFETSTSNIMQTVEAAQTITFPPLNGAAYMGTSVLLKGSSDSGLPVTYTLVSGPAALNNNVLTYTGVGTVVVEADQAGNATFAPAPSVQQTIKTSLLSEPVGTSSLPVTTVVVFAKPGVAGSISVLTLGVAGLDFAQVAGGTCVVGATYAARQTCTVAFTLKPSRPGQRFGGIVVEDASGAPLGNSYIYGFGAGPEVGWIPGVRSLVGANLSSPSGVALNGNGDVFVSQYGVGLTEIPVTGAQRTIGTFGDLADVIVDGSGNLLVAGFTAVYRVDAVNGVIPANPTIETIVAGLGQTNSIKVDATGNIFIATSASTASGVEAIVSELLAVNGVVPANPVIKQFGFGSFTDLSGVAVDPAGNVYVSDFGADAIYELQAVNGVLPTAPAVRSLGGTYSEPANVALDAANDVFIPDATHGVFEIVAVNGVVPANPTVIPLQGGSFISPQGLYVDPSGNIYVADMGLTGIVKFDYYGTQSLSFATTAVGATSTDSPQTVTLINNGNAPLTFAIPASGTNASITAGFAIDSSSTCPVVTSATNPAPTLGPGATCTQAIDFKPIAAGPNSGKLVETDNALNVPGSTQTVLLNGMAIAASKSVLTATPTTVFAGQNVALTATVTPAIGTTPVPTGTVTFYDGTTAMGPAVTLVNGVATMGAIAGSATLPAGSDSLTCVYSGDSEFAPSNCAAVVVTVQLESTTLTVTQIPDPVYALAPTTFKAVMTTNGQPAVAGNTVVFTFSGSFPVGAAAGGSSVTDATGTATLVYAPGFDASVHTVTAAFAATATMSGSTVTKPVDIIKNNTSMTLIASPTPGYQYQPVNLIATIADTTGPASPVEGTVVFTDVTNGGSVVLGTVVPGTLGSNLASATLVTTTLSPGLHTIQAAYSGGLDFNAAAVTTVQENILPQDFTLTADPPSITIETEHHKTMTLLLTPIGGFTAQMTVACTGVYPMWVTCYLPSTVALGPTAAVPVSLTIDTDAVKFFKSEARPGGWGDWKSRAVFAGLLPVALLGLVGRRRRRFGALMVIGVLSVMAVAMTACSGQYPAHTAPGSYTLHVTATGMTAGASAPTSHTLDIALTVTQ